MYLTLSIYSVRTVHLLWRDTFPYHYNLNILYSDGYILDYKVALLAIKYTLVYISRGGSWQVYVRPCCAVVRSIAEHLQEVCQHVLFKQFYLRGTI